MSMMHLLKSLCHYTPWNYAVFWKLNHYLPMTLTWEDGYWGFQKANEAVESRRSDINFEASDDVFSSSIESTCGSGEYSVRLLMTEMSNLNYTLGEGIVGKLALKGDHFWVFCEDIFTSNFNTDLISECPHEWLLQFASGIKTIVLIPVLPHGVLQFGSFQVVAEDLAFVSNIKEKFNSVYFKAANNTLLGLDIDIQASSLQALADCLMDNSDDSSSNTKNKLKASLDITGSSRLHPAVPSFFQDDCHTFGEAQLESLKRENKNENNSHYISVPNDPRHIALVEKKFNQVEEKLSACSQWVNNVGVLDEIVNGTWSYSGKETTEQQFGFVDTNHKISHDVDQLFDFSLDCESYKALGSYADAYVPNAESLSKYFSIEDTYSSSTLMHNEKDQDHVKDLQFHNHKEGNAEYGWDDVVGNLDSASDVTSLSITNGVMDHITLSREYTTSIPPPSHSEESTLIVDNSDPEKHITPAFMAKGGDDNSNLVTSTSFDGNSIILTDETDQKIHGRTQHSIVKKRARVGNTKRQRPRDRQLIMDRMKELRDLIPDGSGCSIDNLLDRTIKHMLYLKNITNQAEKLKQCLLQEVPECKRQKINDSHPGRSCAFDFESENQVCPLIIEDLGCSGNMVIEMICSEQGIFLEIANVIRRMELTIMKGVLESRSSTFWACFIVEVPRGFHRMDILCPLLHLLQLSRNSLK